MTNIKNMLKKHKIIFIIISLVVFVGLIVSFPSLAKFKNRNTIYTVSKWDGSIAESYKNGDGTIENPYIISNGSEFAFFIKQLETINYEGKYFELSNDIIINPGVFEYDELEGLKYVLEGVTYYVKEFTNEYYSNVERQGEPLGVINQISMAKTFKGNLNGKSFTIFGMYMSELEKENLALFENLEGSLNDLYITNSIMYGKGNVAGIAVSASSATLKNIVYDGNIINKSDTKISENEMESISIKSGIEETSTVIKLSDVSIDGYVKSIKLTGEYECSNVDSVNTITINGVEINNNSFEIDLTNNSLLEIPVLTTSTIDETQINLLNLKYSVEYYDEITSGIIAMATNTTLNNVINKSNVYGYNLSSGIVGLSKENLQIIQSYNTGNVKGLNVASGIVGLISNNLSHTTITNVYNKGAINSNIAAAIIGVVKENIGLINITNVINISENYSINTSENSTINIVNSYSTNGLSIYSGLINGEFVQKSIDNLCDKTFMTGISYNEFVSFEDANKNTSNVWIYDKGSLPILHIDDLNDPIASINISKYSWNNLSSELNIINTTKNITFNIEDLSPTKPVAQKYYYVTNDITPLSKEELDKLESWKTYENIVTIKDSGYYVIYAKIVDTDNEIIYINTDIIVLNTSGFKTEITMDDYVFDKYKSNLNNIYLNKEFILNINAQDDLFGISRIEYVVSDVELLEEDLNNVETWETYGGYISINTPGSYIIYAKITNGEGAVKYINTDYLLYNGYKATLSLGSINNTYDTNYITNKSSISLIFEGNFELEYKNGYTHNLISNILLPIGTKLTLIDKMNNKVYLKTIDTEEDLYGYNSSCNGVSSCSKYATYAFDLFKSLGTKDSIYYDESLNYDKTISSEKYVIIIDFKDTNLIDNYYDLTFNLVIKDGDGNYLYRTLDDTVGNINIYSNVNNSEIVTKHNLTSNYENQTIYYNSNSKLDIGFYNTITYSTINNKNIIDTTYENKKAGLLLKLYNEENKEISKQYLDNMIFELDGKEYLATSDNSIKINLGSVSNLTEKVLTIKTKENSSGLENGTYYIKVSKFMSDDGYYYESLYEDDFTITLIVENQEITIPDYSFDIEMQTDSVMLDKNQETHLVSFNIFYYGDLIGPNIRVSLYKKDELTAYNQDYTIVNIQEYTSGELVKAETNKYFVDLLSPTFDLNIQPNKFENTGYKYVFELYDGSNLVSKIEKYFIVK